MRRATIFYATRSKYKREELDIVSRDVVALDGSGVKRLIGDIVEFRISDVETDEPLEIDLTTMVKYKVRSAYRRLLSPCIVEHAGLIFDAHKSSGFPGGLTQPMWDSLTVEDFLERTSCVGERVTAQAIVGFCDGMKIHTFTGETNGVIAAAPRGERGFYWDVVFCPDGGEGKTYAEMADEGQDGLKRKMMISQSTKALRSFVEFLARQNGMALFDIS
jgi:XTP/dITP diphosphohydrolase